MAETIHVVIAPGAVVLGAYRSPDSADLHARLVGGVSVVSCELHEHVPRSVLDDVGVVSDHFEDDETPVERPIPKALRHDTQPMFKVPRRR